MANNSIVEILAISSSSGHISKRALRQAQKRIAIELFGKEGLKPIECKQPSEQEYLLKKAHELRELAIRGMRPRSYLREAQRLEQLAIKIYNKEV